MFGVLKCMRRRSFVGVQFSIALMGHCALAKVDNVISNPVFTRSAFQEVGCSSAAER